MTVLATEGQRPLLCGFLKVRNEIAREGNIYRAIANLRKVCDVIVACDDASSDGTREYLQRVIPPEHLLLIRPEEQDFRQELAVKNKMMEIVHRIRPHLILWSDADEEIVDSQIDQVRPFCEEALKDEPTHGWKSHYVQAWRSEAWSRVDDGFGDGHFVKLWRWSPGLSFREMHGTHHQQFPQQIDYARVKETPWKVFHWGNYGKNLTWKCIQYYGGLGGVDRHLSFENAEYQPTDKLLGRQQRPVRAKPMPFTEREKRLILAMKNLKNLDKWFTVVIPTFNRAKFLPDTLASLVKQTYPNWVAFVLDDGSTDDTQDVMRHWQDRDPRIFYGRYEKMGAVAVNEIGMSVASEATEFFTRLGSDDIFEPHKLRLDAAALSLGYDLVYGSYRVHRDGELREMCNLPEDPHGLVDRLGQGHFAISWANFACSTKLLRQVKSHYGAFCDPRLRNMEDFLVNYRLTRFADPIWRGIYNNTVIIDPGPQMRAQIGTDRDNIKHDAMWRVNPIGASSDTTLTGSEDELTRKIILEDTNGSSEQG